MTCYDFLEGDKHQYDRCARVVTTDGHNHQCGQSRQTHELLVALRDDTEQIDITLRMTRTEARLVGDQLFPGLMLSTRTVANDALLRARDAIRSCIEGTA